MFLNKRTVWDFLIPRFFLRSWCLNLKEISKTFTFFCVISAEQEANRKIVYYLTAAERFKNVKIFILQTKYLISRPTRVKLFGMFGMFGMFNGMYHTFMLCLLCLLEFHYLWLPIRFIHGQPQIQLRIALDNPRITFILPFNHNRVTTKRKPEHPAILGNILLYTYLALNSFLILDLYACLKRSLRSKNFIP